VRGGGALRAILFRVGEQPRGRHAEHASDLAEGIDGRVSPAPLQERNIRPMQTGTVG